MSEDINADEYWASIDDELAKAAEEYNPNYSRWTEEEKRLLKKYYGKVHVNTLCKKLGRSVSAVRIYAQRIGVAKERF